MSRLLACALICVSLADARADDKPAAEALFVRAKELDRAGDVAGACPLFEASYRADPQLGALLNMANCHEALGRTGVAWAEFREAAEIATRKSDPRVDYARKRATALEPRLVRLRIDAAPGIRVVRGDTDVTSLVAHDVVVDPGSYSIVASAPGHQAWNTTIDVRREGATEIVQVPALVIETVAAPVRVTAPRATPVRSPLRTMAFVVGGLGLGVAATGLGFGAVAYRDWNATRDASVCDRSNICSAEGRAKIDSARSHARTSTYLVAGGGAAVAASLVLLWISPRTESAVLPIIGEHGAGMAVRGAF